MTLDLVCLLILALWSIPLNHIPALARVSHSSLMWGVGNRETLPLVPAWVERADRAQRNHHDNLAMIASVILMVTLTQQTDPLTGQCSVVIVTCRILHSLTYIAGILWVRSLLYFGALGALLVLVVRLLG